MKKGFTLAEVLITIGILGIIAAMTLPALKSNIDKNTWVNGLKVGISQLNNAFALMKSTESVDDLRFATLWADYVSEPVETPNDNIKDIMDNYLKIEKMTENTPTGSCMYTLDGNPYEVNSTRYYLGNGSTINIVFTNDENYGSCEPGQPFCHCLATILLDVNGDKKPNTLGKDIFSLVLGENASVYVEGTEIVNKFDNNRPTWQDETDGCAGKQPKTTGIACGGRVVDENFQMNYQ